MSKRFVSSLLALTLLAGCSSAASSKKENTEGGEAVTETAAAENKTLEEATKLVGDLGLSSSMTQVKDRVVLGMFFNGDQDAFTAGSAFLSSDTGKTDTVGVFDTENVDSCKEYLNQYLESAKAQAESYYPEEVFKISNAIIEDNGSKVVFVICDDIESAKGKVAEILK